MDIQIYKNMFDKSPLGFAIHKVVVDEKGNPTDYIFLDANLSFERMTGLKIKDIIGKKVTEVLPGIEKDSFNWIKTYGELSINGGELEFEQYSTPLKKYFKVYAYSPEKFYFITTFIDITSLREGKI